jgi:hypothetical protein
MQEPQQEIGAIASTGKNQHYESQQSSYHPCVQGDHRPLCGTSHRHQRRRGRLYWISLSVRVILASPRRHYRNPRGLNSEMAGSSIINNSERNKLYPLWTASVCIAITNNGSPEALTGINNRRRALSETTASTTTGIPGVATMPNGSQSVQADSHSSSGDYRHEHPTQFGWQEWSTPHDKLVRQRWPL